MLLILAINSSKADHSNHQISLTLFGFSVFHSLDALEMSIRRKQKPDMVKLNLVSSIKDTISLLTISKLQVPIVLSTATVSNDRDVTIDDWDVPETTAAAAAIVETNDNQSINSRH